jgi:hypothetical protein
MDTNASVFDARMEAQVLRPSRSRYDGAERLDKFDRVPNPARSDNVEHMVAVSRPRDKCLAGTLQPPRAEEVRESERRVALALASHDNERRQDRLSFLEAHIDFSAEAGVPAAL